MAGSNANEQARDHSTGLMAAASGGFMGCVKLLMENKANIQAQDEVNPHFMCFADYRRS